MLRLTELKLPLDHTATDLRAAILNRLGIADAELRTCTLFRRGQDARKRGHIQWVYTLDIETTRDAALLEKFARDPHIGQAPDTDAKLMLRDLPGVFCAGEMLDWEAPTGGYLLTACFASGRVAGRGALNYLKTHHAATD